MTMMTTMTTMASAQRAIGYDTMTAADDEDNEVDGDGATGDDDGDGATGDEVDNDGDGTMGDDDADDNGDGTTGYDAPDPPTAKAAPKKASPIHPPKYLSIPLYASTRVISGQMFNICPEIAPKMPQILPCTKNV